VGDGLEVRKAEWSGGEDHPRDGTAGP